MLSRIAKRSLKVLRVLPYIVLDKFYVPMDKRYVRRTRNIRLIPFKHHRVGGKHSYAEWAHVIGIFQTLMFLHLPKKENNVILDVGCGTGLLAIASEPFLGKEGYYLGIDVMDEAINFCQAHYPSPQFSFVHLNVKNPIYAPSQKGKQVRWPVESGSCDLLTALSVWTHFNEEDAIFYFTEVHRVLKPGGKAIMTFFLLDDVYEESLGRRFEGKMGRYHMTFQDQWIFDRPAYGSKAWFYPKRKVVPEGAMGITIEGFNRLLSANELRKRDHYQGNWKEVPGVFFQDIVIVEKPR